MTSNANAANVARDINLTDLFSMLLARKRLIASATLLGVAGAAAISLFVTPLFTATAAIMPPQQSQSVASALLGQIGALASSGRELGLRNPGDLYVGVLESRTVADEIIKRFDLKTEFKTKTLTDTRLKLAKMTHIEAGKDSLLRISVDSPDPKRASDLANAYVDALYRQNTRMALAESNQRRVFFEGQLQAVKESLIAAEMDLKSTQQKTGLVQVSSQAEAAIRSVAQTRAEIMLREVGLQRLRAGATAQNPEVVRTETEISALRGQLSQLESTQSHAGDPLLPPSMLPNSALEYLRRAREVRYQEAIFEALAKQYEAAKIDEAKQAPVIQVVDQAVPPDLRSWPKRRLFVVFGAAIALILSSTLAFFLENARLSTK
jgi:uncharacterized protein involved in exopolysaccharide biosynthesis